MSFDLRRNIEGGKRGVISIAGQMAPSSTREETLVFGEREAALIFMVKPRLRDQNNLPPAPPLASRPDRGERASGEQGGPPSLGKK